MLRIKPGASVAGLRPEILIALIVANDVYGLYGQDCVLTEGTGGQHGRGSLHYVGLSVDIRTNTIRKENLNNLVEKIRTRLGAQYDVVLEPTHLHIEFQPK